MPNFGYASVYGVLLIMLTAIAIQLYRRATKLPARFVTVERAFTPRIVKLGKWKYIILAACVFFILTIVGMPIFIITWTSLIGEFLIPSLSSINKLSINAYVDVLNDPAALRAIANTLFLASFAGLIIMGLSCMEGWIVRLRMKLGHMLDVISGLPQAIPGIVLGLSLLLVYLRSPIPVYGTIWILLIAYNYQIYTLWGEDHVGRLFTPLREPRGGLGGLWGLQNAYLPKGELSFVKSRLFLVGGFLIYTGCL